MKKIINFIALVTIALAPASIAFWSDMWMHTDTGVFLQNHVSTNGCEHIVVIKWQEYALDYNSYVTVENAFIKRSVNIGMLRQRFNYDFTGITWRVTCSRGNKMLPEIKIYSYTPKYTIATFAKLLPNMYNTDINWCKHTVQIWSVVYALDQASYKSVENIFLNTYNSSATIYKSIKYRLTGNEGTIACAGLGNKVAQEITIWSIY
jgi:hypothetical protein